MHAATSRHTIAGLMMLGSGCGPLEPGSDTLASSGAGTTTNSSGPDASTGSSSSTVPVPTTGELPATTTSGQASTTSSTSSDATSTSDGSEGSTTEPPPPCPHNAVCMNATPESICRRELVLPDGNLMFYWANLALEPTFTESGCNMDIERVIVVQHGNSRNAWDYFDTIVDAATTAGVADTTIVVAPWFPADEDAPPDGFARWEPGGSGWKSGDASTTAPAVSSFAVYDHLASLILDTSVHPRVSEVVVTGHSAGGQFVQRYAIAGDLGGASSDATLRWIVANPSSYLYLDPFRWDGQGTPPAVSFVMPAGTACDDDYDDYKYGLSDIPPDHYISKNLAQVPATYLGRDVTYLLGEADTEADPDLDITCPANLQGAHRLERGLVFAGALDARFPGHDHEAVTVPGVGHSKSDMYGSPEGLAVLFP